MINGGFRGQSPLTRCIFETLVEQNAYLAVSDGRYLCIRQGFRAISLRIKRRMFFYE